MPKSGFVTIAGRPSVGKSTLINRLVGSKIAITTPRPQTTRSRIVGVVTRPQAQIVFVDTPGVDQRGSALAKSVAQVARHAAAEGDLTLFLTDASRPDPDADQFALRHLRLTGGRPMFLVINKIDAVSKERLMETVARLSALAPFKETIPISALTGENVDTLLDLVEQALPEGPQFYPGDMVSDQPERFVIGEIIREKAMLRLQQELPYALAVAMDEVAEREDGMLMVAATLYVERESQKGIVIGKGGAMIREIGSAARRELEARLGARVFLDLMVKVREKWTHDPRSVRDFGYGAPKE